MVSVEGKAQNNIYTLHLLLICSFLITHTNIQTDSDRQTHTRCFASGSRSSAREQKWNMSFLVSGRRILIPEHVKNIYHSLSLGYRFKLKQTMRYLTFAFAIQGARFEAQAEAHGSKNDISHFWSRSRVKHKIIFIRIRIRIRIPIDLIQRWPA